MERLTEEQLNIALDVQYIREHGYCAKGTKAYWKALGLDFKKLTQQKLTLRDLLPYKEDVFIKRLITELVGVNNGK